MLLNAAAATSSDLFLHFNANAIKRSEGNELSI